MEAAEIVDRRRLRRKLSFWRLATFVALAAALIAVIAISGGTEPLTSVRGSQIARISIGGFIDADRDQLTLIDRLAKTDSVKAVIVSIDSTGGTTAGGEATYEALRKLAAAKPVVATMQTVAASAAYMIAIATDHIVARRTTVTGSIGVIFESPEVSRLLDKLGISMDEIKSAPLKAEPSPFHPASAEAKAVMSGVVADTYAWFVDLVAERRGIERTAALGLADGRIFTGGQALAAKLIDEIGGEDAARTWLASAKNVSRDLPVRDWKPSSRTPFSLGEAAMGWAARELGLPPEALGALGVNRIFPRNLRLDGLLSLWQGSSDRIDGEAPR